MTSLPLPFGCVPGRDTAQDRTTVEIARYYYEQRSQIAADAGLLRALIRAVDRPNDLEPAQWAQWYSVALGFAPDLILELGRDHGNSTALFTQAASRLGTARVVSLCHTGHWSMHAAPRIAKIVERRWFERLDARVVDILNADYDAIIAGHRRVLVLWDAHGFDIAETVLGEILPRLLDREHLLLMHDISDNRYAGVPRSYDGQPLWKGSKWQERTRAWESRVNIGWMNSIQDQAIALADFSARNDLEIGSADREYSTYFDTHPQSMTEMRETIGEEMASRLGHWAFLSLTGKVGPFHFPSVALRRPTTHCSDVIVDEARSFPVVLATEAKPWGYAATWTWRPVAAPPADAQVQLRVRVKVEGGAIGVSLLNSEGTAFVEAKVVAPGAETTVSIPVNDGVRCGRLVIHTWDLPVPARVRVDELSMVW